MRAITTAPTQSSNPLHCLSAPLPCRFPHHNDDDRDQGGLHFIQKFVAFYCNVFEWNLGFGLYPPSQGIWPLPKLLKTVQVTWSGMKNQLGWNHIWYIFYNLFWFYTVTFIVYQWISLSLIFSFPAALFPTKSGCPYRAKANNLNLLLKVVPLPNNTSFIFSPSYIQTQFARVPEEPETWLATLYIRDIATLINQNP